MDNKGYVHSSKENIEDAAPPQQTSNSPMYNLGSDDFICEYSK